MRSVLVLLAHPHLFRSRINRLMADVLRNSDHILVHDLYETYPDFHLNIKREQRLLTEASLVVMQHPLYWYSCPAILREWQDRVLEKGFAYAEGGGAAQLGGKGLLMAVSTGGSEESYQNGGSHGATVDEYMLPFKQMARRCSMVWYKPLVMHNSHLLHDWQVMKHAEEYRDLLLEWRDGKDWPTD